MSEDLPRWAILWLIFSPIVGGSLGLLTHYLVLRWVARKKHKARIAAVYETQTDRGKGLIILTPARMKIPLPERYEDDDDPIG